DWARADRRKTGTVRGVSSMPLAGRGPGRDARSAMRARVSSTLTEEEGGAGWGEHGDSRRECEGCTRGGRYRGREHAGYVTDRTADVRRVASTGHGSPRRGGRGGEGGAVCFDDVRARGARRGVHCDGRGVCDDRHGR